MNAYIIKLAGYFVAPLPERETNIRLDYIDRIQINQVFGNYTNLLVKTIEQKEFNFGGYLSAAEKKWLCHEINEMLATLKEQRLALLGSPDQIASGKDITIRTLLAKGIELYQQNQLEQATSVLNVALMLDPDSAEAHNNLGVIQFQQKLYTFAVDSFTTALDKAPSYRAAWLNLIIVRQAEQDIDRTLEVMLNPCPEKQRSGNAQITLLLLDNSRKPLHEQYAEHRIEYQRISPSPGDEKKCMLFNYLNGDVQTAIQSAISALNQSEARSFELQVISDIKEVALQALADRLTLGIYLGLFLAHQGKISDALAYLENTYKLVMDKRSINALLIKRMLDYIRRSEFTEELTFGRAPQACRSR